MHIHILGICGTFMGSLAILARQLGHTVTGSDQHVYPPMSTQLQQQGIEIREGYEASHLTPRPDLVVIGNALSRGNPAVEHVLNEGIPYTSGPQWLADQVLPGRWVLAVAGTHGKTTTSTMLAWVLDQAGLAPGFLIGGVPLGFPVSARLGDTPFFVIEADEYDSAFFDKRSKFVHYRPRTLIFNNLEFDHADIFDSLADIQRQFHHLICMVPGTGLVITPAGESAIEETLAKGCWTPRQTFGLNEQAEWSAELIAADGSEFDVKHGGQSLGRVQWTMTGQHSVTNALATIIAARHVGVKPEDAIAALSRFGGVKRRLETIAQIQGLTLYDDFAHHPTAIITTLDGLRQRVGSAPILAIIEPRSNTMKMGVHKDTLLASAEIADQVIWSNMGQFQWLADQVRETGGRHQIRDSVEDIVALALEQIEPGMHVVLMSNGGFGGIHEKLAQAIEQKWGVSRD